MCDTPLSWERHTTPPPRITNDRQLPPRLSAFLAYQFRYVYRGHPPHVDVVDRHQPVPDVYLPPYRTRVLNRVYHRTPPPGGVDDHPEESGGGVYFQHLVPYRRAILRRLHQMGGGCVAASGIATAVVAVVPTLFDGFAGIRPERGHGRHRPRGLREGRQRLLLRAGEHRPAGIGEREVSRVNVVVIGIDCGYAACNTRASTYCLGEQIFQREILDSIPQAPTEVHIVPSIASSRFFFCVGPGAND